MRQAAVGLNFIDTYQRTGLYPVELPAVLGLEGAGVVAAAPIARAMAMAVMGMLKSPSSMVPTPSKLPKDVKVRLAPVASAIPASN